MSGTWESPNVQTSTSNCLLRLEGASQDKILYQHLLKQLLTKTVFLNL